MKLTLLFLAAIVLIIGVLAMDYHGDKWQQQTAQAKFTQLWSAIIADKTPGSWYGALQMSLIFVESMLTSFDTTADDMPTQFLGLETRPKLIHTQGPIAQCKFTSYNNHNYTGLLKGWNYGFLRFSVATEPTDKDPHGFKPGFGLKVMRDKLPSGNFVAMYALTGYPNKTWNFFKHDFTNHVPMFNDSIATFLEKQLSNHFTSASTWTTMVGLSDFAHYDESGRTDPSGRVSFPFRLVFHPFTKIHNMYSDDDRRPLGEVLKNLPIGPVYQVWAEDKPYSKLVHIGDISITSAPTPSYFGDRTFFIQHQRMDDDFTFHPEWVAASKKIVEYQASIPYYAFDDLPWN